MVPESVSNMEDYFAGAAGDRHSVRRLGATPLRQRKKFSKGKRNQCPRRHIGSYAKLAQARQNMPKNAATFGEIAGF
jgi:hypothetical protein